MKWIFLKSLPCAGVLCGQGVLHMYLYITRKRGKGKKGSIYWAILSDPVVAGNIDNKLHNKDPMQVRTGSGC